MTVIHIGKSPVMNDAGPPVQCQQTTPLTVLFKFRADVEAAHKEKFVQELKTLKNLPCVRNRQLFVGGPSITTPIEKSKGFEYSLVSFHPDREALAAYQASEEHER